MPGYAAARGKGSWFPGSHVRHAHPPAGIPGLRSVKFCPRPHGRPKFGGGLRVGNDQPRVVSPAIGINQAVIKCRAQSAAEFGWRTEPYEFETERLAIDLLLGRADLRPRLEAGEPLHELEQSWGAELEAFESRRDAVLLY